MKRSINEIFQMRDNLFKKWGIKFSPFMISPLYPNHNEMKLFINREIETKEILSYFATEGYMRIYINGKNGVGKTTFVNRLIWELKKVDDFLPVYISLIKGDKIEDFISIILEKTFIELTIKDSKEYEKLLNSFNIERENLGEMGYQQLLSLTHNIFYQIPYKTTLFIDNLDQHNPTDVITLLRPLRDELMRLNCFLIFVGNEKLLNQLHRKSAITEMFDLVVEIKSFDENITKKLIENRLKIAKSGSDYKNPFTDDAIKKIHTYSRGNPKKILEICRDCIQHALVSGIEEITSKIVNNVFMKKLEIYEESLTESKRRVLRFLKITPVAIASQKDFQKFTRLKRSTLSQILNGLEKEGYVTNYSIGKESFYTILSEDELKEMKIPQMPEKIENYLKARGMQD